ncbi:Ankyrin-2 [Pseudocercospora fuligena]|uniref:Ankyrin-2 n=1 Tax=Pseudocercospora fuligena TaxID=685502 RepID=A0A8H6RT87_9PEZI|nr:Ankyrin-2 [Pseudocercospora fuligena]
MAPRKGKETLLELCTATTTLGNTIAVHLVEYLSTAKQPSHGFKELAVEFLETSRILFPAKAGLTETARTGTQFPADITQELRERFHQTNTVFVVLNQLVNKFLENERKQGFGKLGKGFRMMFADTDIEKMRMSLTQCRAALRMSALVFTWTLGEDKVEAASSIGYTALAAVLGLSEPQKGKSGGSDASSLPSPPPRYPNGPPLSPEPKSPGLPLERHTTMNSSHPSTHPYHTLDDSYPERESSLGPILTYPHPMQHGKTQLSHQYSKRSSVIEIALDNASDVTRSASLHDDHDFDIQIPKTAIRVRADPSAVHRRTPSHYTGEPTSASKMALVSAVQQKNSRVVEQLLESGVPADNGVECNLLRVAVTNHDLPTVHLLLLFGADPNAKDKDGFTPLHAATEVSFYDAAQLLVKYCADPNISAGPNGINPFAVALTNHKSHFAQLFLRYGAEPDLMMLGGNTPFLLSIDKSTPIGLIELMLVYEANPDCKNGQGETALFKAINAQRLDIVTLLLDHGADPNLPGPKHMIWPSVHHPRILELMLQRGASVNRAPGCLELSTSINKYESVDILLKHGADPNTKKDGIFTPLCTAIRDDRSNLVDILIAAGADPNLKASEYPAFKCVTHHRAHLLPRVLAAGADPSTPKGIIETAVAHNNKEALIYLLEQRVDPNARTPQGDTALTTAIRHNRTDLIDILLAHGADPAVHGQDWPVSMAVKHPQILAKLLPKINVSKINKGSLEMAVVANQLESVKLLLAKGMSVEDKNGGVFSPLTTSIREDRKDIFYYLVDEAGADPNAPGEHLPIIKAIRRHREHDLSYIEHLLAKGADINLMYRGWNAVLQALDNGDTEILKLLAKMGNPDLSARDENDRSVLEIMQERGLQEEARILLGGRSPSPQMKQALSQLRGMVVQ